MDWLNPKNLTVLAGVLIVSLLILYSVVRKLYSLRRPNDPVLPRVALVALSVAVVSTTWLITYVGLMDGILTLSYRRGTNYVYLAEAPFRFWAHVLVFYFVGLIFFAILLSTILPLRASRK